jgi:YHS domain-containing protein
MPTAGDTFPPLTYAPETGSSLPTRVPVKCHHCGTVVMKPRSTVLRVKPGTPMSCSRACHEAAASLTLVCEGCGAQYARLRSEAEKAKRKGLTRSFCTKTCYHAASTKEAQARAVALAPAVPLSPTTAVTAEVVRADSGRRRYYSAETAALSDGANRLRPCASCGVVRKSKAVLCRACYQAARAATYLTLACTHCQAEFTVMRAEHEKRVRGGQERFFCGPPCHQGWQRAHPSGVCDHCKGPMKIDGAKRRFCSKACRVAVRNAVRAAKSRPCPNCGRLYVPRSSRQQYCDRTCADLAHSKRMVGAGNSRYKDGTSYAEWFRRMRPLILERDGKVCRACRQPNEMVPTGRSDGFRFKSILVVHHINEDPADNRPENLIALCHGCHMRHHKSATTPFPWFASYAVSATRSMTSRWTATVTSLQAKFSSTTA